MNNDIELLQKWAPYHRALNLSGLDRILPFNCQPGFKEEKDYFELNYSLEKVAEDAIEKNLAHKSDCYVWLILPTKNIYLRFRDTIGSGPGIYSEPIINERYELPEIYLHDIKVPYHIRTFSEYVKTNYTSSTIKILDYLPFYFSLGVTTNFNLKNREVIENTLKEISNYIVRMPSLRTPDLESKKNIDDIVNDSSKSMNARIDELFSLLDIKNHDVNKIHSRFSYCLACGKAIEHERKFCNSQDNGKENKDNCRNKFNYWISARLGIQDKDKKAAFRNQFYKELQDLISEYPLTAFDKIRQAHPILFEKRYKERWKREQGGQ